MSQPPGRPPGALDLRLAIGAGAAWVVLVSCLGWSPRACVEAGLAACVIGVLALVTRRSWAQSVALCAFCVALVLVPLAARAQRDRASPLTALANRHAVATLELVVSGDAKPIAAHGLSGAPRVVVPTQAVAVYEEGRRSPLSGGVTLDAPSTPWTSLLPGQRVRLDVGLGPALAPGPTGVSGFARTAPQLIGRPPWWQRIAGRVRAGLRSASSGLPDGPRGLLPGLVDGDTSTLDPVLAEHFKLAGLTHLVAVSGTNCSIVVGAVLFAMRRTRARPWLRACVGAVVVVAFVVVARPSPSVLRAAFMALVALAALAGGRPRQGVPALSAAVLVLLAWNPLLSRDVGFAMSVLATAALLTVAPRLADALTARRVPGVLAGPLAVATAAHLVTAPLVAAISGRVSLVAIPANVLAEPVVAPATVLGFLAALMAPLSAGAGALFAQLAGWPCRWLVRVADYFGGLHGATVPWPATPAGAAALGGLCLGCAVLLVHSARARRAFGVAVLVGVLIQIPVRSVVTAWPPPGWLFVACDVGQGDGLALNAGPGSAVVVDTGPDPVLMDRCLHDLDVRIVPLLVLTHLHLDHVSGVPGVLHGRSIARVVTGPLLEPVSGLHLVQDALGPHGLSLARVTAGAAFDIGAVHLDVLGPAAAFHGTRSDPNNSSLVMRAAVGGVRLLLSADAEVEAQQAMLDRHVDVSADVLKVPHHGSAYSEPAFLAAVHAGVALISVGLHNDYGHPAPSLLAALDGLGLPVRRTDHDGDVAVTGRPGSINTIVRGKRASSVGMGAPAADVARTPSQADDRMNACLPVRSESTSCPIRSRPWSCSSATRSCSSGAPSARSPPSYGVPTRRPT